MVDVDRMYENKMIRLKYARAYYSALAKMQAKEMDNSSCKEYEFTPEEKEALICYINNRDSLSLQTKRSR